jgi:hypothetical protein
MLTESTGAWRATSREVRVVDQDLLTTVAVTLATKTAEGLAAGGRAAFEALVRLVRRRSADPESGFPPAALAETEIDLPKDARIEILRRVLAQAIADDPGFEAELRDRWRELSPHLEVSAGNTVNTVSGAVSGNVVQARDVHGGISFGTPGRPEH